MLNKYRLIHSDIHNEISLKMYMHEVEKNFVGTFFYSFYTF